MKLNSSDKNYTKQNDHSEEKLKQDKERFEEIYSEIYGFLPPSNKYHVAWNMFLAGMGHERKRNQK